MVSGFENLGVTTGALPTLAAPPFTDSLESFRTGYIEIKNELPVLSSNLMIPDTTTM